MKVTAILNQKGGAGKTTLALHVAACLAQRHRVLFIDADPQGTAMDWRSARDDEPPFPIVALPTETLHKDLAKIGAAFDHVVIDGAPRLERLTRSAIGAADVVLIPAQPSGPDIWAAAPVVKMIQEAQHSKPGLQAAFVVTRLKAHTALGRAALDLLAEQPFPVMPALIHDRVAYAESITSAATVLETQPKGAAAAEIRFLALTLEQMHAGRPLTLDPQHVRTLDELKTHLAAIQEAVSDENSDHQAAA